MKRVTVCCKACNCYYDIQAFDEGDLKDPVCLDCRELIYLAECDCTHDNVRIERFDAGRSMETGYCDSGERIICCDCGFAEVA